jgi:hypothetical protein
MKTLTNDPYLDTVRRTFEDKKYKELYKKKEQKKINRFMQREINITDYINLSKEIANLLIAISFLILPYIIGVVFIFLIIAKANLEIYERIGNSVNQYLVSWAIGYEVIATFLLLLIIKSAIFFEKRAKAKS